MRVPRSPAFLLAILAIPASGCDRREPECATLRPVTEALQQKRHAVDALPDTGAAGVRMGLLSIADAARAAARDAGQLALTVPDLKAAAADLSAACTETADRATEMADKLAAAEKTRNDTVGAVKAVSPALDAFMQACDGAAGADAASCLAVRDTIASLPEPAKDAAFDAALARVEGAALAAEPRARARAELVVKLKGLKDAWNRQQTAREAQKPARDAYKSADKKLDTAVESVGRACKAP